MSGEDPYHVVSLWCLNSGGRDMYRSHRPESKLGAFRAGNCDLAGTFTSQGSGLRPEVCLKHCWCHIMAAVSINHVASHHGYCSVCTATSVSAVRAILLVITKRRIDEHSCFVSAMLFDPLCPSDPDAPVLRSYTERIVHCTLSRRKISSVAKTCPL